MTVFFGGNYKKWKPSRNGSSLMIFEIRSMIFECFDHARHVPDVRTSKSSYFRRKTRGYFVDFFIKKLKKWKCSRNGSWCIENQHKLVQTGSKFCEKANREVKKITGCVSEQFYFFDVFDIFRDFRLRKIALNLPSPFVAALEREVEYGALASYSKNKWKKYPLIFCQK